MKSKLTKIIGTIAGIVLSITVLAIKPMPDTPIRIPKQYRSMIPHISWSDICYLGTHTIYEYPILFCMLM